MKTPSPHLDRDLGDVFVAAVHGVAGLKRGDLGPAEGLESGARLLGPTVERGVGVRVDTLAENRDRAAEVDLALGQHLGDPGMGGIGGAEYVLALQCLVRRVDLGQRKKAHRRPALGIDQRNLLAPGQRLRRGRAAR